MRQNNITQAIQQAQDKNLRMLDLGGCINSQEGFETVDLINADLIAVKNINGKEGSLWDVTSDIAFGCMVNDKKRLDLILKNSHISNAQCFTIYDPESAAKGLNILLDTIEKSGASIGILTHQDMFYREHWLPAVRKQLEKLPEDWVIAGIVGKDERGILCGRFHDMSTPLWIVSEHNFPVRCSCIDECTIIVNMKTGFRFDEEFEGFDLYGTYACLRANEMGSAWIIDAWAEHYCTRFFGQWDPGEVFKKMWKWLYNRFPNQRLESTVLVGKQQTEENQGGEEKKIKVTREQFERMQINENNTLQQLRR